MYTCSWLALRVHESADDNLRSQLTATARCNCTYTPLSPRTYTQHHHRPEAEAGTLFIFASSIRRSLDLDYGRLGVLGVVVVWGLYVFCGRLLLLLVLLFVEGAGHTKVPLCLVLYTVYRTPPANRIRTEPGALSSAITHVHARAYKGSMFDVGSSLSLVTELGHQRRSSLDPMRLAVALSHRQANVQHKVCGMA
jgi:hypothetical protein